MHSCGFWVEGKISMTPMCMRVCMVSTHTVFYFKNLVCLWAMYLLHGMKMGNVMMQEL